MKNLSGFWKKQFDATDICNIIRAGADSKAIEINFSGFNIKYNQESKAPTPLVVQTIPELDSTTHTNTSKNPFETDPEDLLLTDPVAFENMMMNPDKNT